MSFHNDFGPSIIVNFYLNRDTVSSIVLSNAAQKGTEWHIVSDSPNMSLEKVLCSWMDAYCQGTSSQVNIPLCLDHLTPFLKKVLLQLYTLPFGQSMSYQKLAASIDQPTAARAVGNACAHNPLPLLIPCHRILAAAGHLGGFSGGISIKRKLLAHEGISSKSSTVS